MEQISVRKRKGPPKPGLELKLEAGLQRLARRADEITQHSNIGAVLADAPGVHRQTEPLGEIEINARVVQLRQTKSLRRQYSVYACPIHRPTRSVTPPPAPRWLRKLFPIAVVP